MALLQDTRTFPYLGPPYLLLCIGPGCPFHPSLKPCVRRWGEELLGGAPAGEKPKEIQSVLEFDVLYHGFFALFTDKTKQSIC
ncbi:hypothetical protein VPH35_038581 [Triticum aestivum]